MTPAVVAAALRHAAAGREGAVADLAAFVRFPSVSAQPAHGDDVRRCAEWLAVRLRRAGLSTTRVIATPGHPLVYGEWLGAPGRPTLLIYGHYDVQPPGPAATWRSPPFTPTLRDGALYGRGASDDKGQILAHVLALEAYLRTSGRLPLNVRCLFEGEEEIGSPHLPGFLAERQQALAGDAAVVSDTRFLAPGRPALTYALRGALSLELLLRGQPGEVHSGSFGGAIPNATEALCRIIAGLHHPDGRVAVPGFYEPVRRWGAAERAFMAAQGPSDDAILRAAGATAPWGEPGYSLYERTTIRPAITVSGLTAGYQGPGGKAIIPATATAKLNLRLVPDQEPDTVERQLRVYVAGATPPGLRAELRRLSGSPPVQLSRRHPVMRAAAAAYRRGFGAAPALLRSGGSIPIVGALGELLGLPVALMGFALPDDAMHGPNERFQLEQLRRAVTTCIWFMHELAGEPGRKPAAAAGRSATR
jgi:acetylornithine deacetylase/succinyl-diaminopimelate desuccinylase-like protein